MQAYTTVGSELATLAMGFAAQINEINTAANIAAPGSLLGRVVHGVARFGNG